MTHEKKLWLAKWAIRVVIVFVVFGVAVIIARWMVSVDRSAEHREEIISEHTREITKNHDNIEDLQQDALVSPTPNFTPVPDRSTVKHTRTTKRHPKTRPWWSKLFNP